MNTPICDFVRRYSQQDAIRLHMPGHKGSGPLGIEHLDITEIEGADVLYQADGIIRESEEQASLLFGSSRTIYSTEGSSLPIRAMLYLVKLFKGKNCTIAAGRNAHKVFITAAALLDIRVNWIYPDEEVGVIACPITPDALDSYLSKQQVPPDAVYLTSPDYLGHLSDIRTLSEVAHRHRCLLLVDNAHGAYLNFLPQSLHPLALGADLCCDSAHKTLPVLTGGAYLHVSKTAPSLLSDNAERAMAMFASTSPSYLILQSLDAANGYLADGYCEKLKHAICKWDIIRSRLRDVGYHLVDEEPLKLTVLPKSYGYTGTEMASLLQKEQLFVEFADPDHLVMMLSPEWNDSVCDHICSALASQSKRTPVTERIPPLSHPVQVLSPNEAVFAPSQEMNVEDSLGCIMASACVSCPPAIPIVSIGERISQEAIELMKYYGIRKIHVVTL